MRRAETIASLAASIRVGPKSNSLAAISLSLIVVGPLQAGLELPSWIIVD